MQALYFDGTPRLVTVPSPQPEPGEALIRVRLAGICGTDLAILRGYHNFRGILGHEFVGEVVQAPEPAWLGKRVVGDINLGCGRCPACRRGLEHHCPHRRVLGILGKDGCLAEYVTLPLANLYEVPAEVPDAFAVFAEPLAAALQVLEQVHCPPDSRVLIVGDGRLGLLTALVLRLQGCELHLVGRHPHKLDLARGRGVIVYDGEQPPPAAFEVVIEASGSPSGWETAVRAVRPRGTIVLKSTIPETVAFRTSDLVVPEVTVVGSRCGPLAPALRLLAQRLINPRKLISRIYPLAEAEAALQAAAAKDLIKVLVEVPAHET